MIDVDWLDLVQPYDIREYRCGKCGCYFRMCKYDCESFVLSKAYLKIEDVIYCPNCKGEILENGEEFEK